jgi:hypothetical protein
LSALCFRFWTHRRQVKLWPRSSVPWASDRGGGGWLMFGWFRKRKEAAGARAGQSVDPALRGGIDSMVAFLRVDPTVDDDAIVRHLSGDGLSKDQATKLVQFVPIAFTRFLYRSKGIRFAPNYVVLGPDGQPATQRPVAEEPAFHEAWGHCEQAAASGEGDRYFILIAARSGGYRAIRDLVEKGLDLAGIVTGPPVMMG